jgi:hypothetical protein
MDSESSGPAFDEEQAGADSAGEESAGEETGDEELTDREEGGPTSGDTDGEDVTGGGQSPKPDGGFESHGDEGGDAA